MASSDVDYDEVCSICLEKWHRNGDHQAVRLPCGHIFGYSCISRWVQSRLSCPICRRISHQLTFRSVFQRTAPSVGNRVDADLEAMIERRRLARARRRAARRRRLRLARQREYQENVDNQPKNEACENAENEVST